MNFKALLFSMFVGISVVTATGGSNEWKCVYSPYDNSSLWVTAIGPHEVACAGPSHGVCYWFEGKECCKLISDTQLVGKICPCCSTLDGWCGIAHTVFHKSTSTVSPAGSTKKSTSTMAFNDP